MNTFIKTMASVLEVDTLGLDDEFRNVPEWCSLKAFGLLVMMENDYSTPLTLEQFGKFKTVRDLYREAFRSFAATLLKLPKEKITNTASYGLYPEWDSVNHLRLVMEAEKRFGVHYPLETIPAIKTINDFLI